MKEFPRRIRRLVAAHQFWAAIALVIAITGVLTSVSMTLYVLSGASGLDLSRPGFSDSRKNLQNETAPTFSSTGSLNGADMTTLRDLYSKQRKALQNLGNFDDDALSDESLGFTVSPEPVPDNQ